MKHVQFLSNSPQIEQIVKGITLTKSLKVSSLIIGEPYAGKKTLVQSIFPYLHTINAKDANELQMALSQQDELVIYNIDAVPNLSSYDFSNKKIIAISDTQNVTEEMEEKFAFIYQMPSLKERDDDVSLLANFFCQQIREELMIEKRTKLDIKSLDLSENIKSLKASIYRELVTANMQKKELEELIYKYLYPKLDGNNAYREHLEILERPMIRAGLDKYGSQLKLSSVLGLNRNTLRKKINEHNID